MYFSHIKLASKEQTFATQNFLPPNSFVPSSLVRDEKNIKINSTFLTISLNSIYLVEKMPKLYRKRFETKSK